jgi:5-formyltetrahydrofolate cyclo-ligase
MSSNPKEVLRQRILARLIRQSPSRRAILSERIGKRLRQMACYRQAKTVLCYVAVDGEVDTRPLLDRMVADGKRLAVPVVLLRSGRMIAARLFHPAHELVDKDRFGIPCPRDAWRKRVSLKEIDLAIVPGIAFDRSGGRLGRGKGHFDRFLERLPPKTVRVGLAFRFQMVRKIPKERHDQPVHWVVTD